MEYRSQLEWIRAQLMARQCEDAAVKGDGIAAFVVANRADRAVNIACDRTQWWVDFWETDENGDEASVDELYVPTMEEAIRKASDWMRLPGGEAASE